MPTGIGGEVAWLCPSLDSSGDGTTALNDLSGQANNGVLTNMDPATDWVADALFGGSKALDFDGSNDRVACSAVTTSTTAVTVSVWFLYRTWSSYSTIVNKNGHFSIRRSASVNNLEFLWFNGTSVVFWFGSAALEANTWHHAALVVSGNAIVGAYINGAAYGSQQAVVGFGRDVTQPMTIGGRSDGFVLDGRVDDVRVFQTALTATQIRQLASRRAYQPPALTSLGGEQLWICPSLDTPSVGAVRAYDLSYNGNAGTLTNMDPATDWVNDSAFGGSKALDFDGTNDHLVVPTAVITARPFTITAWIYVTDTTNETIWCGTDMAAGAAQCVYFIVESGKLQFLQFVAGQFSNVRSNLSVPVNQWVFVSVTAESGILTTLRVNNTTETVSINQSYPTGLTSGRVGALSAVGIGTTHYFSGQIDDLRIFNYALSNAQICRIYSKRAYQHPAIRGIGGEKLWVCPTLDSPSVGTSRAFDLSFSDMNGTLTNMDPATDWVVNTANSGARALDFDGINDRVVCGQVNTLNSLPFTFSAWVYPRSVTGGGSVGIRSIASKTTNTYNSLASPFEVGIYQSKWFITLGTTTIGTWKLYQSVAAPVANTWTHICFVATATTISIYINGVLDSSGSFSGFTLSSTSQPLNLGITDFTGSSGTDLRPWDGLIDDVRVFASAINPTQIGLLASSRGYRTSYPIGIGGEIFWLCPSLDSLGNGTTTAFDLSSGLNDGVLTNMDAATDWVSDTDFGGVRALDFDGTNDRIVTAFRGGTVGDKTVSLWLFARSVSTFQAPYSAYASDGQSFEIFIKTDGRVGGGYFFESPMIVEATATANTWQHWAVTQSGNTYTLYRNGSVVAVATGSGRTGTTQPLILGCRGTSFPLNGRLDDIRVFPTVLNATQIGLLASKRGYQPITANPLPIFIAQQHAFSMGSI